MAIPNKTIHSNNFGMNVVHSGRSFELKVTMNLRIRLVEGHQPLYIN
jgi:hypothetical protein